MPRQVEKYVVECRPPDGDAVDLTGIRLDQLGHEGMPGFMFDPNDAVYGGRFDIEIRLDICSELRRIAARYRYYFPAIVEKMAVNRRMSTIVPGNAY